MPGKKTSQIHSVNFEIKQTSLISAQYLCHIVLGGIILLGEGSVDGGEWSKASRTGNTLFNNSYKIWYRFEPFSNGKGMKKVFVGEFWKEDLKIFDDGIYMEGDN